MCLGFIYEGLDQIKDLDVRVDGYIWLWKVFDVNKQGNLVPQFNRFTFYEGKNTARGQVIKELDGAKADDQYEPGFHCFVTEHDAERWSDTSRNQYKRERIVVPIKVKKSWITTMGTQSYRDVVVCKHIII